MKLIKSIASYKTESGWIPQRDIEMHSLEEGMMRAHWAIQDVQNKIPPAPSKHDEHEWLIAYGPEYVKKKRDEHKVTKEAIQPELDAAHLAHQHAVVAWDSHVSLCQANGVCADTFIGDARYTLKMPEGK